ncbi:hypothetical protein BpHYR1_006009 [Brachionus plicatilis]|uniref:Uncharacterized protein n=1 Tax=Brachionus plicatilis TaxID=10195 RepID=A0A3M7SWQ4_BRAPC|nr:hypothetical protein BpHYR1_006009 [Brachionus plicatilis]
MASANGCISSAVGTTSSSAPISSYGYTVKMSALKNSPFWLSSEKSSQLWYMKRNICMRIMA